MKEQLSIFDYPNRPGWKKRKTSKAAAKKMETRAPSLRDRVLEVLRRFAFNSDEVAHALGESQLAIRPRLTELLRMGLIEDTGTIRSNDSGRMAIVFRAKKRFLWGVGVQARGACRTAENARELRTFNSSPL